MTGAGLQQTLHQEYQGQSNPCVTGKRADTHGYVAEGKGQLGGWPREGSRDAQPGCSRGYSPRGHTSSPHSEERPVQSSPQGTERLLQDVPGYPQVAPEPWERRWRRADRDQGPGLQQSCWVRRHIGPCCSCHQQLPAQGEGTYKETHPALQLETRRRRKCTWCFEFRKLQISILQGIALIHLLSVKGQRDIVYDHHHQPLQGHRPLGACLLPALYPHHHGARAQAPAEQLHTPLEHLVRHSPHHLGGSGKLSTRHVHCLAG